MASRDNDEQLPSNNDTASSSNGTTSNLLSLSSNNLNTRRVFGVMSNNDDNIALTSTSTSRRRASRRSLEDKNYNEDDVDDDSKLDELKVVKSKKKQKTMKSIAASTTAAITTTTMTMTTTTTKKKGASRLKSIAASTTVNTSMTMNSTMMNSTTLHFTDGTTLTLDNISTNIIESARTMADHLNVNYITSAPSASRIKSIIQNNEMTVDERVEEIYKLSQQLPCWNSHIVTSNIMIIIIMVRRSPYIIYLIYWQILQCCLFILYLLSIGDIPMQHHIERTVLFGNGDSRYDILYSEAFQQLLEIVIKNRNRPMTIVLPRTLTLGLSANEIEIVILLFTKINKQIRIVSADSPGMNLLDVARANEVVHTNSRSHGSSTHVNPLPSPTTPAQAAIKE